MGWSDSGDTSSDFSEHVSLNSYKKEIEKPKRKNDHKRHACTHEGCKSVFSRPYRLAAHLRVHAGEKPFRCEFIDCNKSYTNKSHLKRHTNTAHKKKSTAIICCPQCDNLFSNQQNLNRHIRSRHDSDFPFRCDYCQLGFVKKNVLAAHIYLHTGIKAFKCDFCEETFSSPTVCYNHKKHHKIYKCVCGKEFTTWSKMVKHKKDEHAVKAFQCDDCEKVFKVKAHIARHVKIHKLQPDQEVFECPFDHCPKHYPYKSNLSFHIKSVHEGKTFDCTFPGCHANLSTKAKLDRHRAKQHLPLKTPIKILRKKQIKRKDVGKFKRSSAVKLAGVVIPISMESEIIKQNDIPIDVLCIPETSTTNNDLSLSDIFDSDSSANLQRTDTNVLYFSNDTIIK